MFFRIKRKRKKFARNPSFLQGKPPKDPVFFSKKNLLIFWKPPHSTQPGGGGSYIFENLCT